MWAASNLLHGGSPILQAPPPSPAEPEEEEEDTTVGYQEEDTTMGLASPTRIQNGVM